MKNSLNLKIILGTAYLIVFSIGIYFLFSFIDLKDLTNYEFIRSNREIISKYQNENFLFLTIIFIIISILWILLLGFVLPLLIFSGFVFGKWWGTLIVVTSIAIGSTLLYMLANFFFQDLIKRKLEPKFYNLKKLFIKNDILYFMIIRFLGGVPFVIQNILPVLFNMRVKNYFIATLIGPMPTMFISVAIGSGIDDVIEKNEKLSFLSVLSSPEIYIPIIAFIIILLIVYVIKKLYFKH
ncbi:MAG: DedA family protein [Candidatus Pelagibacterales bacterium]|nr:MAG: DedA family protein [Pelagibacterales bacterium]